MKINATLFVQIANFIITYKVLDALLFRPAIKSLDDQQNRKRELTAKIENEKEALISLEKEKREKLETFQKNVQKKYPFKEETIDEKQIEYKGPQEEVVETDKLKDKVAQWIVEKVPHEY